MSVFLIWRRRHALATAPIKVSGAGAGAALVLSLVWLVARVANVQIGEQLAATMLIPTAVLALIGVEATRRIAFPLAFLLFAVPFGEVFIPALMDFTASFTVGALRLTGIPVLREGFYFKIPSGDFEVAKACSGIRYLIACLMLGVLYAHLSFRSWRKQLIFVAVSIVAPIVANGIRAYGIVMIAHLSDMRLAVGIDHLIYGWLFFGAMVALLFWIGDRFRDDVQRIAAAGDGPPVDAARSSNAALVTAAVCCVAMAGVGPYIHYARYEGASSSVRRLSVPLTIGGWQASAGGDAVWQKPVPADALAARGRYSSAAEDVDLLLLAYPRETQHAETVGAITSLVDLKAWQLLDLRAAPGPAGTLPRFGELVLRGAREYDVIWYWYVVADRATSSDFRAKMLEARGTLLQGQTDSTLVVVSARAGDAGTGRAAVRRYVADAFAPVNACLFAATDCVDGR
jgi:exosortase A